MKTKKVSGERERIVTVRVPESIHKPARVRASGEDHSFQNILLDCLRRYGANLNVPTSEQQTTCPHCGSTFSGGTVSIAAGVVPESVPISEQREFPHNSDVPSEGREWLDLIASAVHVEDPDWREMLDNIKTQLAQVAAVADREKERGKGEGTGVRRGDRGGTAEFDAARGSSVRATKPRREKAG